MRGEYTGKKKCRTPRMELPPRARRIPTAGCRITGGSGTTSACAENTMRHPLRRLHSQNYLRVRGEYCCKLFCMFSHAELPPRARRIHYSQLLVKSKAGTTSACAENTLTPSRAPLKKGNYLRVRGEYHQPYRQSFHAPELPPRARRIRHFRIHQAPSGGTTSACAENTAAPLSA